MADFDDSTDGNHLAGTQSLARSLHLLRLVARSGTNGLRLADATRWSGLARSTAHRLMRALEHEGFVEQDKTTERYFLGLEAFAIGLAAETRFSFAQFAVPYVVQAAVASGDTAILHLRRGDDSICVAREEGAYPIRTHSAQPGDKHPLGIGAGGLAILATLAEDDIQQIIHRQSHLMLKHYGVTADMIAASISEARITGFAINPGRVFPESWAIGVALVDSTGTCRGSLALAGIRARIDHPRSRELGAMLHSVAADCMADWANSRHGAAESAP